MELNDLGWNESLAEHFRPFEGQGRSPASRRLDGRKPPPQ
jgi:hypothetical protein